VGPPVDAPTARAASPPHQPIHWRDSLAVGLPVRAGAVTVYVGPNTGLTGPPEVVQAIPYHDNHLHVRIGDTDP
jgi:hypothetical protein